MKYPTIEEVEGATRYDLCRWWRFLPGPGWWAVGRKDFETHLRLEAAIMRRIGERMQKLGGFTPEISKALGLEE